MGRSAILGARANRGKGRLGRPQRDGNWPPRSANRRKQPAEEPYRAGPRDAHTDDAGSHEQTSLSTI